MRLLNRLERRFSRYAIPNLTILIIAGQTLMWLVTFPKPELYLRIQLIPELVLGGELWRLFTFVLSPPLRENPLFFFFGMMLFYIMGSALERTWGAFRFNVYLFSGYIATVAVAFLNPEFPAANYFIGGAVFLAFAHLYPDFTIQVMFILPVKVRWLAWLAWIIFGLAILTGPWHAKLPACASVANFFLFFGNDIYHRMRTGNRRMRERAKRLNPNAGKAFHVCTACGRSDKTDPTLDFRYCSKCDEAPCFCEDHIADHEHVVSSDD